MSTWSKKEILERVAGYDNVTLFDQALIKSGGDDYDGAFTSQGSFEFDTVANELHRRLVESGFLPTTPKVGANESPKTL